MCDEALKIVVVLNVKHWKANDLRVKQLNDIEIAEPL